MKNRVILNLAVIFLLPIAAFAYNPLKIRQSDNDAVLNDGFQKIGDIAEASKTVELTGIIKVHNFAGGGGSGSLMSGPSIYLQTDQGTYAINNPTASYNNPLWQQLLPLNDKQVTITADIAPISPFSDYKGSLENIKIGEQSLNQNSQSDYQWRSWWWGGATEMDIGTHNGKQGDLYQERFTTFNNGIGLNDQLTIKVIDYKTDKKTGYGTFEKEKDYILNIATGEITIVTIKGDKRKEKVVKPGEKKHRATLRTMLKQVKTQQRQDPDPSNKEKLQTVIDRLDKSSARMITEVLIAASVAGLSVKDEKNKVSVSFNSKSYRSHMTLDKNTNTIRYYLPENGNIEGVVTQQSNPKLYKESLERMIRDIESALTWDTNYPLTKKEKTFVGKVVKELKSFLHR